MIDKDAEVRYIKLGREGSLEDRYLHKHPAIRLGYHSDLHQACLDQDWELVAKAWLQERKGKQSVASNDVRQIRDFYELPGNTVWITFHNRKLYWCTASEEVIKLEDQDRIREATIPWSCDDVFGNELRIENIDGRISQVQAYKGTICEVSNARYVKRRIMGEKEDDVIDAELARDVLQQKIQKLIEGLWWYDFELLVDLIFSKSGWQRVSVLGKTTKSIDLDLQSSVTNRKAVVQVKSRAGASAVTDFFDQNKDESCFHSLIFVCHTFSGDPEDIGIDDSRLEFWGKKRLAELVVESGLTNWLITKRS